MLHGPAIVMLFLLGLSAVYSISEHGKPYTGTKNAIATLVAIAIQALILWWGGFWR